MKTPITIRQAKKLINSKKGISYMDMLLLLGAMPDLSPWLRLRLSETELRRVLGRALDVEVMRSGPHHVLIPRPCVSPETPSPSKAAEARPKGTDEVRCQGAQPSEESPYHGGDGASGEVPGAAHSAPGVVPTAPGDHPKGATGGGDTGQKPVRGRSATGASATTEDPKISPPEQAGEEPDGQPEKGTEGESAPSSVPTSDSRLLHRAGEPDAEPAQLTERAAPLPKGAQAERLEKFGVEPEQPEQAQASRYRSLRATCKPSSSRRESFGGITARMRKCDPAVVRQARLVFANLLEGGASEDGPRWDWQAFTERLLTRQPLAPARREEEGRPALLVLSDVSGSCQGFSNEALRVAKAVGHLGVASADVIVVAHSNGYPLEAERNGREFPVARFNFEQRQVREWYIDLIKQHNISVVLALGDWDAEWLYKDLAALPQVESLLWLDNFSCNAGPVRPHPFRFRSLVKNDWSRAAKLKVQYVVGCQTEADFLTGIRLAATTV